LILLKGCVITIDTAHFSPALTGHNAVPGLERVQLAQAATVRCPYRPRPANQPQAGGGTRGRPPDPGRALSAVHALPQIASRGAIPVRLVPLSRLHS
jgi:hypothetical protein